MRSLQQLSCVYENLVERLQALELRDPQKSLVSYVTSGELVGTTLVLNQTSFGCVNIDLSSTFDDLGEVQKQALRECLRDIAVNDAFGNLLGYMISPI